MAPRRNFNKNNSTTFSLVYRAQNDPKIHDASASDRVFAEQRNRNLTKQDLDEEFSEHVRENEGLAANFGIHYDDSVYDYMQHLKPLNQSSESHFIEPSGKGKGQGKQKQSLEDALKELDIYDDNDLVSQTSSRVSRAESLLPEEMLPSEFVQNISYENLQSTPDAIAGFQPDMDPRLREVLEALEDDAFVENDADFFEALQEEAEEIDAREWQKSSFDEDLLEDEGWESDRTIKANDDRQERPSASKIHPAESEDDPGNDDWMDEFNKFKNAKAAKSNARPKPGTIPADLQSSVQTGASSFAGLRRKKRKGALTTTSSTSMTSSVLRRTEELSTLDQRFERIQEEYDDGDLDDQASGLSQISGLSKLSALSKISNASKAPSLVRTDFDSIMDDFLGDYSQVGHRRMRRGKPQGGLEQLDEIRKELGPARVSKQKT